MIGRLLQRLASLRLLWPLMVLILICLSPIIILVFLATSIWFSYTGNRVRMTDAGVEIFTKRKGVVAFHAWSNLQSLQLKYNPPYHTPQFVLVDGSCIDLPGAEWNALRAACIARGIPVENLPKRPAVTYSASHEWLTRHMLEDTSRSKQHHGAFGRSAPQQHHHTPTESEGE